MNKRIKLLQAAFSNSMYKDLEAQNVIVQLTRYDNLTDEEKGVLNHDLKQFREGKQKTNQEIQKILKEARKTVDKRSEEN